MLEGGTKVVLLTATDIDSNDLTFSATNGDSEIVVDGTTLTITPPANYNGSDDVTVTVSDGDLSDSTTFTLTVNPVNDAPTLDDLADASVAEDSSYTLELSGADIDGDALTFLASVDANGSVDVDGSTLTVTICRL